MDIMNPTNIPGNGPNGDYQVGINILGGIMNSLTMGVVDFGDKNSKEYNNVITAKDIVSMIDGKSLIKLFQKGGIKAYKVLKGAKDTSKEIRLAFQSVNNVGEAFNFARKAAKESVNLGDDAVPFIQKIGPHQGRVTGMQSADGLKGWRIDFAEGKGFHVNWWIKNGKKRKDWIEDSNEIVGSTEADYLRVLEHFPKL